MMTIGKELEYDLSPGTRSKHRRLSKNYSTTYNSLQHGSQVERRVFPLFAESPREAAGNRSCRSERTLTWEQHRFEVMRGALQITSVFIRETLLLSLVAVLYVIETFEFDPLTLASAFVGIYISFALVVFLIAAGHGTQSRKKFRCWIDGPHFFLESTQAQRRRMLREEIGNVTIRQNFLGRLFRLFDVVLAPSYGSSKDALTISGLDARAAVGLQRALLSHDFRRRKRV